MFLAEGEGARRVWLRDLLEPDLYSIIPVPLKRHQGREQPGLNDRPGAEVPALELEAGAPWSPKRPPARRRER